MTKPIIVVPDDTNIEMIKARLIAEDIPECQVIRRCEATEEQMKEVRKQEIARLQEVMDQEEKRREEMADLAHTFKISSIYTEKPKPKKKSSVKLPPRHNDPEVAKRIRAEREARKKRNFDRRNKKNK